MRNFHNNSGICADWFFRTEAGLLLGGPAPFLFVYLKPVLKQQLPVFIADDFHPSLMDELSAQGILFEYQPLASRETIFTALEKGIEGLVIRTKTQVDESLLKAGKGLRFIARGGAGMDNIDTDVANALNITCFNAGEANSDAVAEHAIGMLFSLFRKIHTADAEVRQGIWKREVNRGIELSGKTVGIVGYGNTGSALARKLSGFGVRILAYDKYKKNYGNAQVEACEMDKLFEYADIVSYHVPLDRHTKFMINSEYLQKFVRKIFLLNLSRGGIAKTNDLISALENGRILGFAADVLEHENPSAMGVSEHQWFDKLIQFPQVVLTPHIGGWTHESYAKISQVLAKKIMQFYQSGKGLQTDSA